MGQNSDGIAKKNPYLEQSETLFDRDNRRLNPVIQNVVHRPNFFIPKYTK